MRAKIKLGFNVLGAASHAILDSGKTHLEVDKGNTSRYVTIEIESDTEAYIKDIWAEGILDGLMCMNASEEDLVKINEAYSSYSVGRI